MHCSLNPTVKLFYLQAPFLLSTLSAKGGRRTISLQVYPFKLIINHRGTARRVCPNSLLVDSGSLGPLHPLFPDTGPWEAGMWGLLMEGKRQDADPSSWATALSHPHGGKSEVENQAEPSI